jgi:hypothetical protein
VKSDKLMKKKKKCSDILAEPRNILAENLGSAEPRLKNTALENSRCTEVVSVWRLFKQNWSEVNLAGLSLAIVDRWPLFRSGC